jgi:hypothetical protein
MDTFENIINRDVIDDTYFCENRIPKCYQEVYAIVRRVLAIMLRVYVKELSYHDNLCHVITSTTSSLYIGDFLMVLSCVLGLEIDCQKDIFHFFDIVGCDETITLGQWINSFVIVRLHSEHNNDKSWEKLKNFYVEENKKSIFVENGCAIILFIITSVPL